MRRTYLFCGVVGCALAALWSCGLDDSAVVAIGEDDASTGDSSTFDGTAPTDSSTDTGVTDTGTTDTGVVDSGPCPLTDLPICDDGTCGSASEACTPPVGSGWTVVNYISGSRPACSAGYAAHDVVEIEDGGPSSCLCNCNTGAAPSCETDRLTISSGTTCSNGSGGDLTAGCTDLSVTVGVATNFEAQIAPRAGTCSGETDASLPNPDGGLSRACLLQDDAGASNLCADHRSCVAKPDAGSICIAHASPATCPNGFTTVNVGDSFGDTRSCPSCACDWNNSGCTAPTVTGYGSSTTCSAGAGDTPISTSACAAVSSLVFGSFGVTGTDTAATCGVTDAGALDGGVAITNDEVVCCSN
jgi:hypothetical protein